MTIRRIHTITGDVIDTLLDVATHLVEILRIDRHYLPDLLKHVNDFGINGHVRHGRVDPDVDLACGKRIFDRVVELDVPQALEPQPRPPCQGKGRRAGPEEEVLREEFGAVSEVGIHCTESGDGGPQVFAIPQQDFRRTARRV